MGFSLSKKFRSFDPITRLGKKLFPNFHYGKVITGNLSKLLYGSSHSAKSYQNVNNAYGVANDYKLDTRYRSLRELTGTP